MIDSTVQMDVTQPAAMLFTNQGESKEGKRNREALEAQLKSGAAPRITSHIVAPKSASDSKSEADKQKALEHKARCENILRLINNPDPANSNMSKIKHLLGYNWEATSIKGVLEVLIFASTLSLKSLMHLPWLRGLSLCDPTNTYDKANLDDIKNKPLFDIKFENGKMVLDFTKPITVNPLVPIRSNVLEERWDIIDPVFEAIEATIGWAAPTLNEQILLRANGYMSPPNLLLTWKAEFRKNIINQLGYDPEHPDMQAAEAMFRPEKPKQEDGSDKHVKNMVAVNSHRAIKQI